MPKACVQFFFIMKAEIVDITKKYRKTLCLDGVSLSMESGKCYCLLGRNGTGKTTLLSVLSGVREPDSGSFLLDGEDLLKNRKMLVDKVAYVPQSDPLIPELSAMDNLRIRYSKEEIEQSLKDGFLKELGIDEFIRTRVSRMSGGMKKRLSIGCAISGNPAVLLLDEPGAALDLICKETIRKTVSDFRKKGGIVLIATHDEEEIRLSDEHYILNGAKLRKTIFNGNISELIDEMQIP